jgi:hypothetical protein
VNRKVILFIVVCLTTCLVALHWRKPIFISTSPAGMTAIQTIQSVPAVHFQPQPIVHLTDNIFVAPPATEVAAAQVQTNSGNSLSAKLEARRELMARLREWAARDLAGALAYVSKMPEGDERDDALQAVCFGLAQKDPAHAVDLAQALQQPEAVMENLVQQWAASDLPSTLVWVNNRPSSDQRDEMIQRIALVLSQRDPSDAASLVTEQISAGPAQDEAVMTVVNQWGNQNLAAAASWVKSFPEGPLQKRAVEELEGIMNYQQALAHQ